MLVRLSTAAAGLLLAGCVTAPPASAGHWRLNPYQCPDLREDWRDRQVTTGYRDLREDIRDERVVNCPPRAWTYVPGPRERASVRVVYPTGVYFGAKGVAFAHAPGRHYHRSKVTIVVR
ncbi:MAG: hypothetical protein AAFX03_03325 [Pseudomonadota bacterium]